MLKVSNIVKEYRSENYKSKVLDGVSFEITKPEIVGITGKSGSGKSTLLKILRGVVPFDSGSIEICDEIVTPENWESEGRTLKSMTAIHLQRNFGLWGGPAIENIIRRLNFKNAGVEALPLKTHHSYEGLYKEAMEILKMVGLEEKALHSTDQLSGGEKQRLVLARQIAAHPKVLLLDEPVTMTGPDTKQEVLDVIKRLKDELNIPIIVVSHLPEIHKYIADRVLFLEDGKIVKDGSPDEVLTLFLKDIAPKEPLSEIPVLKETVRVENISKRYALIRVGEVLNIENMSFDVYDGQIVSLIGSSGAGKTTIMKMMEGLIAPTEGRVVYLYLEKGKEEKGEGKEEKGEKEEGEWINISDYNERRIYLRSIISIMNQEFSMSVNSTVRDQIRFRISMKRKEAVDNAKAKAESLGISSEALDIIYRLPDMATAEKDQVMNELGIPDEIFNELFPSIPFEDVDSYAVPVFNALNLPLDILDRKPTEISGGEHVRAFIALSLATSPKYLFLDEPFGDLDPITLRDVTNALKKINKVFNTTIVLVSHHMNFVKEVAHRALLIDRGNLVMDGDPTEVCDKLIQKSKAVYLLNDFDL